MIHYLRLKYGILLILTQLVCMAVGKLLGGGPLAFWCCFLFGAYTVGAFSATVKEEMDKEVIKNENT